MLRAGVVLVNYLTSLYLIFLICEKRHNNGAYLSGLIKNKYVYLCRTIEFLSPFALFQLITQDQNTYLGSTDQDTLLDAAAELKCAQVQSQWYIKTEDHLPFSLLLFFSLT